MKKTVVVNLFGAPGSGKSTGAAYLFYKLKTRGIDAELVTEFAKDKVWEEDWEVFNNQAYIFGKQSYRLSRCDGKVDVIVTDSPLILSILYNKDKRLTENFNRSVVDVFNSYQNINFLLSRTKPYNPNGRLQTEKESDELYEKIFSLLVERKIDFFHGIPGDVSGYNIILSEIMRYLSQREA